MELAGRQGLGLYPKYAALISVRMMRKVHWVQMPSWYVFCFHSLQMKDISFFLSDTWSHGRRLVRIFLTYALFQIFSWARFLVDRLSVFHVIKYFPAFYGTITYFARTFHWIISWGIWIKFHNITICFLKISYIIILLTTHRSSERSLNFRVLNKLFKFSNTSVCYTL